MKKNKVRLKEMVPKIYIGTGQRCVEFACLFARKGRRVALFMDGKSRTSHWTLDSRGGVYAHCDADIGTEDGLERAVEFVTDQRFDTLLFATQGADEDYDADPDEPTYLTYGAAETRVIEAATVGFLRDTGRITLIPRIVEELYE
jgi:hypothetical protein